MGLSDIIARFKTSNKEINIYTRFNKLYMSKPRHNKEFKEIGYVNLRKFYDNMSEVFDRYERRWYGGGETNGN